MKRVCWLVLLALAALWSSGQAQTNGTSANWFADAIWYQIFPERFRNGDPSNDPTPASLEGTWPYVVPKGWQVSPWTSDWYELQPWEKDGKGFYHHAQLRRYGGDIQGIIDKLDYLQALGVNALYLNPIFESPSLHKYGATMYHHVDKHFGPDPKGDLKLFAQEDPSDPATWKWSAADKLFLQFIKEAHRRKMRVIIDGVFNHVGIPFWALQRAKKEGQGSRFADWFIVTKWDDPQTARDEFTYKGWYGIKDLPELARDETNLNPEVREHIHAVVRRWMDPNGDGDPSDGIDGWRLDVAAEVPLGFWKEFRGWVKAINPNAYLTGEIWWDDFSKFTFRNARPWLDNAFDGVMNYRFGDAVYQFFNQSNSISATRFGALLADVHRDYGYERSLQLQNLFGSHDTSRIGSAVVNPQYRQDHGANVQDNRQYDVRPPSDSEKQRWKQMVAFQFLMPGAPYIYYGDEVGMWGADDPDCRKPMVWSDLQYADERNHPYGKTHPADPVRPDNDLLKHYSEWANRRSEMEVLRRGNFKIVLVDDARQLMGFQRSLPGKDVIAVFNGSSRAVKVAADKLGIGDTSVWRDGLKKDHRPTENPISVPAGSFVCLERSNSP
ncbi:MAG TPA: glycoside hydrolase family 13 protein [Verrucomicrobiae bacterium]|nr:glycoside hydrolase family 13 protein [Verrucomicrobiae bacterium]